MPKKPDITDKLCDEFMKPLREYAKEGGGLAEITRRFNSRAKARAVEKNASYKPKRATAVGANLHPDPEKRSQPGLGAGLIYNEVKVELGSERSK